MLWGFEQHFLRVLLRQLFTVFGGEQHTLTPHYVDPSGPRVNPFFALLPPDILHVLGMGQSTVFASVSRSRPPASFDRGALGVGTTLFCVCSLGSCYSV